MISSIGTLAMLAAWVYLASCFVEDSFYNLHVNRLRAAMFRPVTALQRAVPRLAERGAAVAVFALVFVAAAALGALFGSAAPLRGGIAAGAGASFGGGRAVLPLRGGAAAALSLAAGRFAVLVGQLALVRLLLDWRLGSGGKSGAREFLDTASWPASLAGSRAALRGSRWASAAAAAAALVAGTALCVRSSAAGAAAAAAVPRLALVAAADSMLVVRDVLFVGCVLSWFRLVPSPEASKSAWRRVAEFFSDLSSEALSDLVRAVVGPNPVAVGFVSFAPIVAFFVLGLLHSLVVGFLL